MCFSYFRKMKNNLDAFRILYIVRGCLLAVSSSVILGFLFLSSFFLTTNGEYSFEMQSQGQLPFDPLTILKYLASIAIGLAILIIVFIVCHFLVASFIKKRKHYYFIFTISILSFFTGILGVLLGVFTLIEITKPEVRALFFNSKESESDHTGIIQS